MPVLCVAPACREVVRDGHSRCEKHRKATRTQKVQVRKASGGRRNSHIYDTQRWKRLSKKKRTVTPFCEMCDAEGVTTVADVVDHIQEIEDGGDPYKWDNLMSLCHHHHNGKTAKVKREREQKV